MEELLGSTSSNLDSALSAVHEIRTKDVNVEVFETKRSDSTIGYYNFVTEQASLKTMHCKAFLIFIVRLYEYNVSLVLCKHPVEI